MTFDELGLSAPILEAVKDCGYETPTPIQQQAIPVIMQGKDVIGASQTGTGKSAAFALPLLNGITHTGQPQVLVLEPTRELADQLAEPLLLLASVQVRPMLGSDTDRLPAADAVIKVAGSIVTIMAKANKMALMRFTFFIVMLLSF